MIPKKMGQAGMAIITQKAMEPICVCVKLRARLRTGLGAMPINSSRASSQLTPLKTKSRSASVKTLLAIKEALPTTIKREDSTRTRSSLIPPFSAETATTGLM